MDDDADAVSDWTWEENKSFELALAAVDEGSSDRWEAVASMVGSKGAEDVQKHYAVLLQDLKFIESGKLDFLFGEAFDSGVIYCIEGQKSPLKPLAAKGMLI